ncbi:terminal nucleotidyltransferase 5D-like [Genypterus blacodes]|uniref:terminal nucleotidyltransferase 5D-like n=1 Tax=Genypterus blacodes TaxID=154954 RepID=UPI003F75F2DA
MMELQAEKRFHNLTLEQVQALDKVLTEVIPIYGRGNFPTLQVRAKDIIRVVKERLVERDIQVKDIRLNGATASHVLVKDNGLGYRDLDIIFGVELPRQEDFQVIKEVVLGSLRDLLPFGVNRRKITCLTMKEAYVQKMVKVFNEHDRWSLILLSNNRAKTVGLRFVSSLRRQFEFSVDSFQIILDRMLESYWETESRDGGKVTLKPESSNVGKVEENKEQQPTPTPEDEEEHRGNDSAMASSTASTSQIEVGTVPEEERPQPEDECVCGTDAVQQVLEAENPNLQLPSQQDEGESDGIEDVHAEEEEIVFELCGKDEGDGFHRQDYPLVSTHRAACTRVRDPLMTNTHECLKLQGNEEICESKASELEKTDSQEPVQCDEVPQFKVDVVIHRSENTLQDSHHEFSFPPPAKKTCSTSQEIVPDYGPLPKLQRKMSRKMITKPTVQEKWSLLSDLSDLTTQLSAPVEIPKTIQAKPPQLEGQDHCSRAPAGSTPETSQHTDDLILPPRAPAVAIQGGEAPSESGEQMVKPKHSKKPPDCATNKPGPEAEPAGAASGSWAGSVGKPTITVEAECMYGDFEQAMDHLRRRLIATHNPEEIRGGGLLKYSNLLVRNFRPASDAEIKSLERYMCSRFFIDFPDVGEQQRKIEAYLQCHFIGNEEASKYDYLMTLRRVIDESTVCLMGHERRQTLNMITVLALRVLGEQNAIPNTANVTCFYQPAPYVTEPIYSSYFITQAQPPLVYHPYPLHVHMQSGLV